MVMGFGYLLTALFNHFPLPLYMGTKLVPYSFLKCQRYFICIDVINIQHLCIFDSLGQGIFLLQK